MFEQKKWREIWIKLFSYNCGLIHQISLYHGDIGRMNMCMYEVFPASSLKLSLKPMSDNSFWLRLFLRRMSTHNRYPHKITWGITKCFLICRALYLDQSKNNPLPCLLAEGLPNPPLLSGLGLSGLWMGIWVILGPSGFMSGNWVVIQWWSEIPRQ